MAQAVSEGIPGNGKIDLHSGTFVVLLKGGQGMFLLREKWTREDGNGGI